MKKKVKKTKGKKLVVKPEIDLTIKQRKWIQAYIKTGNATEAAARVYDCKNRDVANAIGNENLAKLSFPELMEEMKLTDVALMNVGIEGMQATKQISGIVIGGKSVDVDSESSNFVEVPDYAVRHKYWETMLKLKKRLGQEKSTVGAEFKEGEKSLRIIVTRGE
jgi:hypothetical protein